MRCWREDPDLPVRWRLYNVDFFFDLLDPLDDFDNFLFLHYFYFYLNLHCHYNCYQHDFDFDLIGVPLVDESRVLPGC